MCFNLKFCVSALVKWYCSFCRVW